MPTMRDVKTPKAPCYCLRTRFSCSMISATGGSWCASSRTSFHRRAHSGRWRSVRGRGKSHNHRIFGGAAGCGRRACPERRRRREQQESAATAQRASEDRVDELSAIGQCDLRLGLWGPVFAPVDRGSTLSKLPPPFWRPHTQDGSALQHFIFISAVTKHQ